MKKERENTEFLNALLSEAIEDGQPHKTAELYAFFMDKTGGIGVEEIPISRKDFLMYLRAQVLDAGGSLKRVCSGCYQKRSYPLDRGVTFTGRTISKKHRTVFDAPPFDTPMDAEGVPLETVLCYLTYIKKR